MSYNLLHKALPLAHTNTERPPSVLKYLVLLWFLRQSCCSKMHKVCRAMKNCTTFDPAPFSLSLSPSLPVHAQKGQACCYQTLNLFKLPRLVVVCLGVFSACLFANYRSSYIGSSNYRTFKLASSPPSLCSTHLAAHGRVCWQSRCSRDSTSICPSAIGPHRR